MYVCMYVTYTDDNINNASTYTYTHILTGQFGYKQCAQGETWHASIQDSNGGAV